MDEKAVTGTNACRIREIRKALKLKQMEFAQKIGLTQTSLSMIEGGKSTITDKNIKLICATFNVNEHWLTTGNGEMFNSNSPYEKEFSEIISELMPETQQALLQIAKQLLAAQRGIGKK
jgi:transcriptional regulator with XRE-family HTH domain